MYKIKICITFFISFLFWDGLISQNYNRSIFLDCRAIPFTKECECDKRAMIDFIHKEIEPNIFNATRGLTDITLDLDINTNGNLVNFKINGIERFDLIEKMDYYLKNYSFKIPKLAANGDVFVSYKLPSNKQPNYDLKNIKIDVMTHGEEIFLVVEEMPRFQSCEDLDTDDQIYKCSNNLIMEYFKSNLVIPSIIKKQKIGGTVVVQFIVTKEGWIDGIQVIRDIGFGSGQAAVDLIESMNNMSDIWIPGKQRGKHKNVILTYPIKFDTEKY